MHMTLDEVSPERPIKLNSNVSASFAASRVSLHLIDANGSDWGPLDEAEVKQPEEEK
jgi:hypothetical protein